MYLYLIDNNLLNYACSSPNGAVIAKINEEISRLPFLTAQEDTGFAMTPFSLLEALGITWPEIDRIEVDDAVKAGADAGEIVHSVAKKATGIFAGLSVLKPGYLADRARERRAHIDPAAYGLFDICVTRRAEAPDTPAAIAASLGYDHAFKQHYPKAIRDKVRGYLLEVMLVQPVAPALTLFRIAKQFWDLFYSAGRSIHNPSKKKEIEAVNKSMRLKTARDFLDCDLIHFACFGWGKHKIAAFTCDPPNVLVQRTAVYKGMFRSLAVMAPGVPVGRLPIMKHGLIICCEPSGAITHVIPTETVPAIV